MSMKQAINNDVIRMRPFIRKARVYVIHKLTKEIKLLRQKKGTDQQKEKNNKKADRYAEEILILKKFKNDEITKHILKEKRAPQEILNNPEATLTDKAIAKIQGNKFVDEHIKTIQAKYPIVLEKFLKPSKKQLGKKKSKTKTKVKTKQNTPAKKNRENSKNLENITVENIDEIEENGATLKTKNLIKKIKKKSKDSKNEIENNKIEKIENIDENEAIESTLKTKNLNKKIKKKSKDSKNEIENKKIEEAENIEEIGPTFETKNLVEINKKIEKKSKDSKDGIKNNKIDEIDSSLTIKSSIKENKPKTIDNKTKIKPPILNKTNKIAEVKPFFELIQKDTSDKTSNEYLATDSSFEIEETVPAKIARNTKKEIDPFFVTADGESKFTITPISNNDSENKPEKQNRIYNDNLNRKQRRSMKRNEKRHFIPRKFDFKSVSEKKSSSITNLNRNKIAYSNVNSKNEVKIDELHPSWQAKKLQKAAITEFQGKKIVFDD